MRLDEAFRVSFVRGNLMETELMWKKTVIKSLPDMCGTVVGHSATCLFYSSAIPAPSTRPKTRRPKLF